MCERRYDQLVEFAPCATGMYAYFKYLFKIPLVVTCNYAAKKLVKLKPGVHDFFGSLGNRVIVKFHRPTFVHPAAPALARDFHWGAQWGCWEETVPAAPGSPSS